MIEQLRSVFALDDLAALEDAVDAARRAGVADEGIALVARHDIELELDPQASDPDAQGHVRGLLAGQRAAGARKIAAAIEAALSARSRAPSATVQSAGSGSSRGTPPDDSSIE